MSIFSRIIIVLIFILAGLLFIHSLTSINADIGRHIGLGKIIWETKEVPKTNLLSFTAPDFPFINHHWLSEVIFYGIYSLGGDWITGLRLVIIFKAVVLLVAYLILFLSVRKHNIFAVVFGFIVSIFVFSARTEPRPEIFSYLIFAYYLFIIYRAKILTSQVKNPRLAMSALWILPILQVFWVNLHIYFIIGPIIYFLFLIDELVNKKFENFKLKIEIFISIILANLVNPNFINGALYPFKVFSNYGYSVAENSSLFFLAKYFGQWAPQDKLFLISLFILVGSFILSFFTVRKTYWFKKRFFDIILVSIMVILSFKMQRNISLYALSLWPVMAGNLSEIFNFQFSIFNLKKSLYFLIILTLIGSIYLIVSGRFYNWLDSAKKFGLGISNAAQNGTDFIKENRIDGPVFNNFDIGSYLAWQFEGVRYPVEKVPDPFRVFIDGRPEAYPADFFEYIYKPMQSDEKVWLEMSEKYNINYIFFAHTDMTEWADEFLTRISKDKRWSMVFFNDAVVIFLKNNDKNKITIEKHKITEQNIGEKVLSILGGLDRKDDNAFINFGNALYRFRWLEAAADVFEFLISNQPSNPYGYQGAGYAYVTMNDPKTQEKAAQNLGKAIDLGFETFNNYFTLGIINANLGDFAAAEENVIKALDIDPDNQNAKATLRTIKMKKVELK